MMPKETLLVIRLDDYPNDKTISGEEKNWYNSLKEGDIIEIELPKEPESRFYVLDKISNYLFTRGYMLYELKRAKTKY